MCLENSVYIGSIFFYHWIMLAGTVKIFDTLQEASKHHARSLEVNRDLLVCWFSHE
jgi:hypothetical protein